MVMELQRKDDGLGLVEMLSSEELECKICYCLYNLGSRRPKVLDCRHRLCSKCLAKLQDLGESPPNAVVCPFCRCATRLPGEAVSSLPDDCKLVAVLAVQGRNQRNLHAHMENAELVLSPRRLSSLVSDPRVSSPSSSSSAASSATYSSIQSSSNFVLITIMEPPQARDLQHQPSGASQQDYSSHSLDSMVSITPRWSFWTCAALLCQTSARALVWVLGLLYFSSLPMGMYLLIMQQTTLGVMLVSLVPASLMVVTAYGLCQCLCHELRDCLPP